MGEGIARQRSGDEKAKKDPYGVVQGEGGGGGAQRRKTLAELAEKFDVHSSQITRWQTPSHKEFRIRSSNMNLRKPYFGLLQHRQCTVATARGWLVLLLFATALVIFAARNLHSFLAVTDPVNAEILVVEAWLPDYALEKVIVEFNRKPYSTLYLTGGPIELGFHLSEYKTYPSLAAATLTKLGLKKEVIQEVPAPDLPQDRTYASALALKKWFREHGISPGAVQVVTLGPHARRTRLLFAKTLGDDFTVGITAIQGQGYHPDSWWATSEGVRSVIGETIAYGYARLFFRSG